MNYNKLQRLIFEKNLNTTQAAKIAGMSLPGFKTMLEKHTMKVDTLEKYAKYFNKPINYFFEEEHLQILQESQEDYKTCKKCNEKEEEIVWLKNELKSVHRTLENLTSHKKEKAS